MPDDFGQPNDFSVASQPQGPPPQPPQAGSIAGLATTGVFLGREFNDKFRKSTDDLAKKGLKAAEEQMKKLSDNAKKFAEHSKDAAGQMTKTGKSAEFMGKVLDKSSGAMSRMRKSIDGLSGGFDKIGKGFGQSALGLITGGKSGSRLKEFAAGLKLIAAGMLQVGAAGLKMMAPLLPLVAIIAAIVAAVKLISYTVRLFKDEIKEMKEQALEPWIGMTQGIGDKLREVLAPAVALVMMAIKAFFQVVKTVGEAVAKIMEKMTGESMSALDALKKGFTFVIEFILKILQPFVDGVVKVINTILLTFGIFTQKNKTFAEKFHQFGQLMITVIVDAAKAIIKGVEWLRNTMIDIIEKAINLVVFTWKKGWDVINKLTGGVLGKIVDFALGAMKVFVDIMSKAWQKVFDIIAGVVDGIASALRNANKWADWLVPDAVINGLDAMANGIRKVGDFGAGFGDGIENAISKLQDLLKAKDIGSFSDFLKSEFAISLDAVKDFTAIGGDKLTEMLDKFKGKFGVDLQTLADEVGVNLLESPDLVGDFRKVLSEAEIKIKDDNLNRKLEGLGEKIDKVNDKDVNIEINPLIQISISGVDDPTEVRRIALEAVDEGLAKAGADIAATANAGDL